MRWPRVPRRATSKAALIENVKADASCFDVSFDYGTFKQPGRGNVSADGKTLTLELYCETQASGANCASGAVGSQTVTLNKAAFSGNASRSTRSPRSSSPARLARLASSHSRGIYDVVAEG